MYADGSLQKEVTAEYTYIHRPIYIYICCNCCCCFSFSSEWNCNLIIALHGSWLSFSQSCENNKFLIHKIVAHWYKSQHQHFYLGATWCSTGIWANYALPYHTVQFCMLLICSFGFVLFSVHSLPTSSLCLWRFLCFDCNFLIKKLFLTSGHFKIIFLFCDLLKGIHGI